MVAPPEIDRDDPSGSQTEYKVEKTAMVDEHKEIVFNRESEHCVFLLDFNGRVPGGPSARFSVS